MPQPDTKLNAFPVFLRVEGAVVVVVGDGDEALAKARLLAQSSATIKVIAERPEPALAAFLGDGGATQVALPYQPQLLAGAVLVFAASGDAELDRRVSEDARRLGIPVNAVDRPELCDFYTPALVNRAPVCVAIGTEGAGPVLAQLLRARIDRLLSPSLGALAVLAERFRRRGRGVAAQGRRAAPLLGGFLRRRAGPRTGGRACRRGPAGGAGAARRAAGGDRPCGAGRSRTRG